MAKDKSTKVKNKASAIDDEADVLDLSFDDEEWAEVEKRKEYASGGGKLPKVGEHVFVCTKFEPGESTGEKTAGAKNYRVDLVIEEGSDDDGARVVEFLIAAKSTAPRLVKALEAFGVLDKHVKVNPETGGKRLVPPTDKECDAFVGKKIIGKIDGYEDQYRDRDKPAEERRQRPLFTFVRPFGKAAGNGTAKADKGKKAIAR